MVKRIILILSALIIIIMTGGRSVYFSDRDVINNQMKIRGVWDRAIYYVDL